MSRLPMPYPRFQVQQCYLLFISHIFLQLGVRNDIFFFFEMRQNKTYGGILLLLTGTVPIVFFAEDGLARC